MNGEPSRRLKDLVSYGLKMTSSVLLIEYRFTKFLPRIYSRFQTGNTWSICFGALQKPAIPAYHVVPSVLRRSVEFCTLYHQQMFRYSRLERLKSYLH